MNFKKKNKNTERILIFLFVLVIGCFTVIPYFYSIKNIRNSILRLHVLANSDTEEDQTIKLAVRDKVLEYGEDIFTEVSSKNSKINAKSFLSRNLSDIKNIANNVVSQYGENYEIEVSVENKYFNTRVYDDVTLPAGLYDSLVIRIGEAKGQNWWCVMFPPMCLPAATETVELSEVLSDEQLHIITDDTNYTVKFAVVEVIEEFTHKSYEE